MLRQAATRQPGTRPSTRNAGADAMIPNVHMPVDASDQQHRTSVAPRQHVSVWRRAPAHNVYRNVQVWTCPEVGLSRMLLSSDELGYGSDTGGRARSDEL